MKFNFDILVSIYYQPIKKDLNIFESNYYKNQSY